MKDDTLRQIAGTLQELGTSHPSMPMSALATLGSLTLDGELTVDFSATPSLGFPLVVYRPSRDMPGWWAQLTPREQEVARLLADGLSNAGISARLKISIGTAKDHVHHILTKSGLRRRSQVAALLA